jgi:SAM-dependent methyltransferase
MASVEILLGHFGATPSQAILDLGCGAGALVESLRTRGFDAWGCDVAGSDASDFTANAATKGYLRPIEMQPYRLPFEDNRFDFVISSQVLEHVMDYAATFREIRRVLKPGGIGLHTFPSRHVLIEPHVFVPIASVIRSRPWLHLWAMLGIRNAYQAGKSASEVADLNFAYLVGHTNYLPNRRILEHAQPFAEAAFREDVFFLPGAAERRKRSLKKRLFLLLGGDRLRLLLFRTFNTRVLYLKK